MAKFYGVNPGATREVNLNNFIGQKGKENTNENFDNKSQQSNNVRP